MARDVGGRHRRWRSTSHLCRSCLYEHEACTSTDYFVPGLVNELLLAMSHGTTSPGQAPPEPIPGPALAIVGSGWVSHLQRWPVAGQPAGGKLP